MISEILATGDEICHGTFVDTNSAHIALALRELGIEVARHSCVGDDLGMLVKVMKEIGGRADIAVVTGGLGPTTDDLTAQAAAAAAGVELKLDPNAADSIKAIFDRFGRSMADSDLKQAMLPEGAAVIYNRAGTAPGFSVKIGKCRFYFLPGIPSEMEKMLLDVIAQVREAAGYVSLYSRTRQLSVFGLPEARINDLLAEVERTCPGVKLGMIARFPIIYVKLTAGGDHPAEVDALLLQAVEYAAARLGDHLFSLSGLTMEEEVGNLLRKRGITVAAAESCTGGLVAHMLTNMAGSSDYFLFSAVTYSNQAKEKVLGVANETLSRYGAVHEETAKEMAVGARRVSGADVAVSTTGIAGPSGGSDEKPVGTVCIGIATPDQVAGKRFNSPFQGSAVQQADLCRMRPGFPAADASCGKTNVIQVDFRVYTY